ncbi:hypothetical protein OH77DRAFT_1422091 [Trametes cingulata]|nr:hypothetical protein OH77DRAFT_1422091 [Trametes cingulata]
MQQRFLRTACGARVPALFATITEAKCAGYAMHPDDTHTHLGTQHNTSGFGNVLSGC